MPEETAAFSNWSYGLGIPTKCTEHSIIATRQIIHAVSKILELCVRFSHSSIHYLLVEASEVVVDLRQLCDRWIRLSQNPP